MQVAFSRLDHIQLATICLTKRQIRCQVRTCGSGDRASPHPSATPFFPNPQVDADRRADEAILLAQSALDEPSISSLKETGREEHESGWTNTDLGAEQDARLTPTPDRVRVRGDKPGQERIELRGRDPRLPASKCLVEGHDKLFHMTSRAC